VGGAVVPDRGGQREQALGDAHAHAVGAAPAVQLLVSVSTRAIRPAVA
jgi:hypothetical protein